ncbi:MAG: hypothetical protein QMC67_13160 [Candidatus Wallbacteria bacterium]
MDIITVNKTYLNRPFQAIKQMDKDSLKQTVDGLGISITDYNDIEQTALKIMDSVLGKSMAWYEKANPLGSYPSWYEIVERVCNKLNISDNVQQDERAFRYAGFRFKYNEHDLFILESNEKFEIIAFKSISSKPKMAGLIETKNGFSTDHYKGKFKNELEAFNNNNQILVIYKHRKNPNLSFFDKIKMLFGFDVADDKNEDIEFTKIFDYQEILNNAVVKNLECMIFDYCAESELKNISQEQLGEIDKFIEQNEYFQEYIKKLKLTPKGARFIAAAIFKSASAGGFKTYITVAKAAALFNKQIGGLIGKKIAMNVAVQWTKVILGYLNAFLWAWTAHDILEAIFGADEEKLVSLICQVYLTPLEDIDEQ